MDTAISINRTFTSVSELRTWLSRRNDEAGSPEAYDEWLRSYFDAGDTISVNGEEYDYWACWELL